MNKSSEAVYGIGLIGALVYFVQTAVGLEQILVGIIKAIFWPGFLVYHLLSFLNV